MAVPSAYGPAETTRRLTESLEDNPNITLLGVVNHAEAAAMETAEGSGLTTVTSTVDFETTVSNLRGALQERGFRIPFVVEHSRSAAANHFEFLPTTLFIFGNPSVGTPLMQLEGRVAVDLPQKMLVWDDEDGTVRITYNDAEALSAIAAASAER